MAGKRLAGLDGLRGIAVLAVVAYHYSNERFYYGLLGVELFFIISGFVILMTLERVKSVGEFALHRFARLYPAYWFALALTAGFLFFMGKTSIGSIVVNATMLQSFFNRSVLIGPSWSLAYELWFYIVMAAAMRVGLLSRIEWLAAFWLLLLIPLRTAMLFGHGEQLYAEWWFQLIAMPQFGNFFIAGMMLYRIHSGKASPVTFAVLLLSIVYSGFGRPDWAQIPPAIYFGTTCLFISLAWLSLGSNLLSGNLLSWIGIRSYAIYLLHVLFRDMAWFAFGHTIAADSAGLSLTLVAAALSWTLIERPAQKWARPTSPIAASVVGVTVVDRA